MSHLAQGETGRLGLQSPEFGPLLRGDVLGHEGVGRLDVGELAGHLDSCCLLYLIS